VDVDGVGFRLAYGLDSGLLIVDERGEPYARSMEELLHFL
jgi:hypothetical protein